jgi:hypothetical protein
MAITEQRTVHLEVREETTIRRPAWEVREQFRDVTYHAANGVHPDLQVAVLERRGGRCHYLLTSRIGPVTVRHDVVLSDADDGTFVHELTTGPLRGTTVAISFEWAGPTETIVAASCSATIRGWRRAVRPLLRRHIARRLRAMLAEDRADLEAGRYARVGRRLLHPSLG